MYWTRLKVSKSWVATKKICTCKSNWSGLTPASCTNFAWVTGSDPRLVCVIPGLWRVDSTHDTAKQSLVSITL